MKKIVKLTESDFKRIVKKVIKEDSHLRPDGSRRVYHAPRPNPKVTEYPGDDYPGIRTGRRRAFPAPKENPEMEYNDFDLREDDNKDYEMSGSWHRKDYDPTPREKQIKGVFGEYGDDILPVIVRYMRKNPEKIIKRLYDIYGEKIYDYISDYSQGEMDGPLDEATVEVDPDDPKSLTMVKDKLGPNDTLRVRDLDESDNPFADVPMWKGRGDAKVDDDGSVTILPEGKKKGKKQKIYGMDFSKVSPKDYKRYKRMLDDLYDSGDMDVADDLLWELEDNYPTLFYKYEDDIKDIVFGM